MTPYHFARANEELIAAKKAIELAREHYIRAVLVLTDGHDAPFRDVTEPIVKRIHRQRLALYADDIPSVQGGDGKFFEVTPTILELAKLTNQPNQ